MLNSTVHPIKKMFDKTIPIFPIWYHKHKLTINRMAIHLNEAQKRFLISSFDDDICRCFQSDVSPFFNDDTHQLMKGFLKHVVGFGLQFMP